MGIVGSFVAFAIAAILRIIFGTLESEYSWLSKVIPVANWVCLGLAALFALFVVIAIITAVIRNRNNR